MNIFSFIKRSFQLILKDKVIMLLTLVPVLIGLALYSVLGTWLFQTALSNSQIYIKEYFGNGTGSEVAVYVLGGILMALIFVIVNWTFVMVVSVLASPFNDAISERVEKIYGGHASKGLGDSFRRVLKNIIRTIFNEIKKVLFILFLTIVGFVLSFYFPPISFMFSALLLSTQFLDYSWSRHFLPMKECIGDYRSNFLIYLMSGCLFLLLMSIPLVNLFSLPFAVVYYTLIWCEKNVSNINGTRTS